MISRGCSALAGALGLIFLLCDLAPAQDWPTRPITMVVPYAAGGPVDTLGRIVAVGLSEILHQQMVIENIGGAGGMTGSSRAAKAAPDGYTLLLGGLAVLGQIPNLYKRPLYNAVTDFAPVSLFADSARILIARKDLPVDSLKDFIAYAQSNQASMKFGSAGAGSGLHVCAVLLNTLMGTNITHVPYRGSALALQESDGGAHRFHVRPDFHRLSPHPSRRSESHRDARSGAATRAARSADRTGAGPGRS